MKVLFLTPPLKAWDSHGFHRAANQMHAQVAAYIRSKGIAEVVALDCRAMDMDWEMMLNKLFSMLMKWQSACMTVELEKQNFC